MSRVIARRQIVWTVVYEHRCSAGDHIVRVDDGDRKVAHVFRTGVAVHGEYVLSLSLRADEQVSRSQVGCVDPALVGGVPERVVRGGVEGAGRATNTALA